MCQISPFEKVPTSILDKFNPANVAQTPQYAADDGALTEDQLSQIKKSGAQYMIGNTKFIDQRVGGQHE